MSIYQYYVCEKLRGPGNKSGTDARFVDMRLKKRAGLVASDGSFDKFQCAGKQCGNG